MKKIFLAMLVLASLGSIHMVGATSIDMSPEEWEKLTPKEQFEMSEGGMCESATDGCNNFFLAEGKVLGGTKMACMDHVEKWECTKYIGSEDDLRICTMDYTPVCGVDGVTYGNACGAGDVEVSYDGECQEKEENNCSWEYEPVCGSDGETYHSINCIAEGVGLQHDGECCSNDYNPVCGEIIINCVSAPCPGPMQKTFSNICKMKKGYATFVKKGECKKDTFETSLPQNDLSLYNHAKKQLGKKKAEAVDSLLVKYKNILDGRNNAKELNKKVLAKVEKKLDTLMMSYPADAGMSKKDTQKYYILKYLVFELKRIEYEYNLY